MHYAKSRAADLMRLIIVYVPITGHHHIKPDIIRLVQLVGRFFEIVVDRFHAAGEAGPVVTVRIERFDDEVGRAFLCAQR